jgi:hypothetical protein
LSPPQGIIGVWKLDTKPQGLLGVREHGFRDKTNKAGNFFNIRLDFCAWNNKMLHYSIIKIGGTAKVTRFYIRFAEIRCPPVKELFLSVISLFKMRSHNFSVLNGGSQQPHLVGSR